jgi:AraC family transcriptional regulator of adaptative response / DNA-3-methyladenine glycosylase II
MDASQRIARLVVQRIEEAGTDEQSALESLASKFNLSSRQIRRIVAKELGVPPIQLLLTRRLLLAKQLLTETKLPIIEVAFASGFASLRRFNDAFSSRYHMPPSRLRKKAVDGAAAPAASEASSLLLGYRPPYDWEGMLAFLKARELKRVEWTTENFYARTVQIGKASGWIRITHQEKQHAVRVEFAHTLTPVLPALLNRVRALLDLDARPHLICRHLAKSPVLRAWVTANQGIRVPGAFSGFELALRAILGQQVTVKCATTLAGRVATAFGEKHSTPFAELNRLTPSAAKIAKASVEQLGRLGIVRGRCQSILALAQAQAAGELGLDGALPHDPELAIERLAELPGIGHWTASYIAMRALRWPDAFPAADQVLRKRLGNITTKQAEEMSQAWRPWRSYAVMHIWKNSWNAHCE